MTDVATIVGRFALFAAVHSLAATRWLQYRMQHRLGALYRVYRLAYNLLSLLMFGCVMAALADSPPLYTLTGVPRTACYTVEVVLLIALCRCAAQMDLAEFLGIRQLGNTPVAPPRLNDGGCYRHVRHPQYSLAILIFLFNPAMTVGWCTLTLLSIGYFVAGALLEERRLLIDFGDEYRLYQRRVPMLVPRLFSR